MTQSDHDYLVTDDGECAICGNPAVEHRDYEPEWDAVAPDE